ncbi:transmembrane protein 79-like [Asterias amurensis]|uniref:transmembrane protein 79-like n=1 Tax=Asterias amurensis TaxID=7602 RepID=UPI003AB88772
MTKPGKLLRKMIPDGGSEKTLPNMNPDLDRSFQFQAKTRMNVFGMMLTLSTFFIVPVLTYVGFYFLPVHVPPLLGMAERIAFALRCQGWAIIPFALGILSLMVGRLRGKEPKDLVSTEHYVRHTMEQYIMLFINTVVMVTFIPDEYLKMVPVCVGIWVVGRFIYWASYSLRPQYRGFAYGIAMLPNVAMMVYNLIGMFDPGFTHGLHK